MDLPLAAAVRKPKPRSLLSWTIWPAGSSGAVPGHIQPASLPPPLAKPPVPPSCPPTHHKISAGIVMASEPVQQLQHDKGRPHPAGMPTRRCAAAAAAVIGTVSVPAVASHGGTGCSANNSPHLSATTKIPQPFCHTSAHLHIRQAGGRAGRQAGGQAVWRSNRGSSAPALPGGAAQLPDGTGQGWSCGEGSPRQTACCRLSITVRLPHLCSRQIVRKTRPAGEQRVAAGMRCCLACARRSGRGVGVGGGVQCI